MNNCSLISYSRTIFTRHHEIGQSIQHRIWTERSETKGTLINVSSCWSLLYPLSPPTASSCRACFATSGIGGSRRASERPQSRANQPLPRRALSPTPSLPPSWRRLRSTQQPGCELARQCHGGFLPFFTLPLPRLSVTSNPNGERDIGPLLSWHNPSCLNL